MTPGELLSQVGGRLDAQRAARALYAERLAPDFSVLSFLDRRENGLSRILAWILDPQGSHAQGDRFLISLMKWLELDEEWLGEAGAARVWTEVPTVSTIGRGFIDILIRCGGRGLAIENKPSAGDQPHQVRRYLEDLAASYTAGHCLLYLSGLGDPPSTDSIDANRADLAIESGVLVVRGYPALLDWLELCLPQSRAPNVSLMIEGLAAYIREEHMGVSNIAEADDLAESICRSPEKLEAALAVMEAGGSIHRNIIGGLIEEVRTRAAARGWSMIRDDLGPERNSALLIGFSDRSTIGFGFQFDKAGHGWLFYGVASEQGRPLPAGVKGVLKALLATQRSTEYWPVWKAVGANNRHFPLSQQADRDFWIAARDGRLATMLVEYVAEAEAALTKAGLIDAVKAR